MTHAEYIARIRAAIRRDIRPAPAPTPAPKGATRASGMSRRAAFREDAARTATRAMGYVRVAQSHAPADARWAELIARRA